MTSPEQPVHVNDFVAGMIAQSRCVGCRGCRLFQYNEAFTPEHHSGYLGNVDPEARPDLVSAGAAASAAGAGQDPDESGPVKLRRNRSYKMAGRGPQAVGGIMVLVDQPTKPEDRDGETASGGNNLFFRGIAEECGLDPSQWYTTYATKCYDPSERSTLRDAAYCNTYLAEEISRLKPAVIIAVGSDPAAILLGKPKVSITHYACVPQNVVVAGHTCVVYPMLPPWYVSANDWLETRYRQHFGRLKSFLQGDTQVADDRSQYVVVDNPLEAVEVLDRMIEFVEKGRIINADIETSGLSPYVRNQRLSVLSLSAGTKRGYAIMYNHDDCLWSPEDRETVRLAIKRLLRHPKVMLRWHNGMFDTQWIREILGFWPRDMFEDTMLTHYSVDENMQHGLKPLTLMLTDMGDYDRELDAYLDVQGLPDSPRYDLVPKDLLGKYAAMDAVATAKLADALYPMVSDQGTQIDALAFRAMPAFSATLARMCRTGVFIDTHFASSVAIPYIEAESAKSWSKIVGDPTVRRFIRDNEQALRDEEMERRRVMNEVRVQKGQKPFKHKPLPPPDVKKLFTFSIDSPKQLQKLIYDRAYFNQPAVVFSEKSGLPSTDKEAMQELINNDSPIAKALMEHRLDEKLLSTYLRPIVEKISQQNDDILHGGFLLHGTVTGRLSSRNPNLQNIPNKGAGLIKRMYTSRYGDDGVFIQADYSQIELRILAAISGDAGMLAAYASGEDLHKLTACLLFNMTPDEYEKLDKAEQKRRRTIAKRVNFGIPYGVGGKGISDMLRGEGVKEDPEVCREYINQFFKAKPRVKKWIDRVQASTDRDEHSMSLFGRRRRLEQVRSQLEDVKGAALRQSVNHPIQSTAADLTMTALALIDQEICLRRGLDPVHVHPTVEHLDVPVDKRWDRVHVTLQVHDMIGIDCHKEVAGVVVDRLAYIMQHVCELAPLIWGDQITPGLQVLKKVQLLAEVEVGPNWRDAVHVKDGTGVDLGMHTARCKRAKFDADPHAKWEKDDDKAAEASYRSA